MSMEMKQNLKLSQQMVMTPQLQMAIKLLQISKMELLEQIREEIKENPFLEDNNDTETEVSRNDPDQRAEAQLLGETEQAVEQPLQKETREQAQEVPADTQTAPEVDWETFAENMATAPAPPSYRADNDELPGLEQTATRGESLAEHLLTQLQLLGLPAAEHLCGELVIGNLDEDGFLKEPPLAELAEEAGLSVEVAESVLQRIQRFDPTGCAARSLEECLLAQAAVLGIDDEVLVKMLTEHLSDLEKRNFARIAQKLKVDIEEVYEAAKDIQRLDPKPGREYISEKPQYIVPDVYIHKVGDDYFVTINDDGLPKLRISSYYLKTLREKEKDRAAKEYVQERLRSAKWLIDSIQQRQRTIIKVTESILKFQRDFFEKGISHLKPLILRDVASDIGMHESTISRATSNKYVHTPQGLYELKYFFNAGINREDRGDEIASEAVKKLIKSLVTKEDVKRPYSDQKLVELLKKEHKIDIARRTVAKYREQLRILPSAQRKQVF